MLMFGLLYYRLQNGIRRSWNDPAFRGLMLLMSIIWGTGVVFYHHIEGWGWIDSLYFCVVTAATVGYGDFSPQTTLGKLFTIAFILCSVGVFVSLAGTLGIHMARATRDEDKSTRAMRNHRLANHRRRPPRRGTGGLRDKHPQGE